MQMDISLKGMKKERERFRDIETSLRKRAEDIREKGLQLSRSEDVALRKVSKGMLGSYEEISRLIKSIELMRAALEKIIRAYEQNELEIQDILEGREAAFSKPGMLDIGELTDAPVIRGSFADIGQ